MLTQINDAVRRSSRQLVICNPMSVDVEIYRKVCTRDDEGNNPENPAILGGLMVLGSEEDEEGYELEKEAFSKHWSRGISEIMPVTNKLRIMMQRPMQHRAMICADCMVDAAKSLLDKYHQSGKRGEDGIHSPLRWFGAFQKILV